MDAIRGLERRLYPCKEIDCNDYEKFPLASDEEFAYMESECTDASMVHVFPYVRNREEKYVEIYIYDVMNPGFIRFIILDGYRFSIDDEDRFFEYIGLKYDDKSVGFERFAAFSREVFKVFPHWHYIKYYFRGLKEAFTHMYYASHIGPREILYKAGLNYLAFILSEVDSYNVMGTNPESILDAPMNLLRILNEPPLAKEYMCESALFEKAKDVYKKYSSCLTEKTLSVGQWKYLEYLYDNDGLFAGYPFMRSLFNRLKDSGRFELEEYRKYITLRDQLPIKIKKKLPKPDEIENKASQLETIRDYYEDEELNQMIAERKDCGLYAYDGEKYIIRYPESSIDFCLEAFNQGNCILDEYIEDHAERETTILFLRRKEAPERSFVTMEITNSYRINQVYGKGNSFPPKEVYEFLCEYAKARWLSYNPYKLLSPYDDPDDELLDFFDELSDIYESDDIQERISVDRNNTGYIQLCFEDCFPELFDDLQLLAG
ncbi:MAG: PcfJ domain-containing protein [Lachnospiraceae bacterium]|nr:PcfJ domain-containing protein [Lachnospiraceae bacterium]